MRKQTKLVVLMMSFCFVLATCLLSVFAVKNFDMNMVGEIEFIAPGLEATISQATLSGLSKKTGSGQMQSFTLTRTMTESQISDLAGVKSWSGIKLLFDEESEGVATISFTITNNSNKAIENIMVNLSTNTTSTSPIQATPSADFCITPGASHTFTINLNVADVSTSALISGFKLTVEMSIIKPSEVPTVADYSAQGITFEINPETSTANLVNYNPQTTSAASTFATTGLTVEVPDVVQGEDGKIYTVTELVDGKTYSRGAFYAIKDKLTNLILPSTLIKIGDYTCYKCKLLQSITISNSVTIIGKNAFEECTALEEIELSDNLIDIGERAFYKCSGAMGELALPDSLKTIGDWAFAECSLIESIKVSKNLKSIGTNAFYKCSSAQSELVFGNCLVSIGDNAFGNCSSIIGDLVIPNSVETIGDSAFYNCGVNGCLRLGKNLKHIGENAFYGTSLVGDLIIPNSVETIGDNAFFYCKFTSLTLGESLKSIGEEAFSNCTNMTGDLIIPDSVETIGNNCFYCCTSFDGILSIGKGLKSLSKNIFYNCSELSGDLVIPDNIETVEDFAFRKCSGFDNLIIGKGLQALSESAFDFGGGFSSITLSNQNQYFYMSNNSLIEKSTKTLKTGCVNSTISPTEDLVKISKYAFYSTNFSQQNLVFSNSLKEVGDSAFDFCRGITGDLMLGENIETIGSSAFSYAKITTVYMGACIKQIGKNAFYYCSSLVSITIKATVPPTLGGNNCFDITNNCTIYVPAESVDAYKTAEYWSEYASRIVAIQ